MWQTNYGNGIVEIGRKKKFCETLIVAMPLPKYGDKKIVLAIVAMTLPKMKKKKNVTKSVKE